MLQKCYRLKKLTLIKNKLANLNFLHQIHYNKTLQELELINQTFTKQGTIEPKSKTGAQDPDDTPSEQSKEDSSIPLHQLRENTTL